MARPRTDGHSVGIGAVHLADRFVSLCPKQSFFVPANVTEVTALQRMSFQNSVLLLNILKSCLLFPLFAIVVLEALFYARYAIWRVQRASLNYKLLHVVIVLKPVTQGHGEEVHDKKKMG